MMAAHPAADKPSTTLCHRAASFRATHEDRKDSVVRFHYTVSEIGQEPIESSRA